VFRSIGDAVFWARSPARRARVSLYLRKAEAVVALWPESADALTQRYGVPADRITVIPTGVPADRFPPVDDARRAAARAALGFGDDAALVLYLGWLSEEKGPQVAINAIADVPDTTLVIAGGGPQRAELERLAGDVASDRVRFLGPVDDASMVMSACDVFVLPASIEGLPAVLIEAGLTGLPVVATDIGAVGEVVRDEDTGIIVPPEDPAALAAGIRTALRDGADLATRLRQHCLDHFEINVVARAWDALLDSVVRTR
jgi:glycosyltransferase involved in cell wall biosynthesis